MTITTKTTKAIDVNELNASISRLVGLNTKLAKQRAGELTRVVGVSLAPYTRGGHGNVCKFATPACVASCVLWFAGRTNMPETRRAAMRRTALYYLAPELFFERLRRELRREQRNAKRDGARLYVRLNVASDLEYPSELFEEFGDVTFYDYTKDARRAVRGALGLLADNYHVTYSVSELSTFDDVRRVVEFGGNVATVFDCHYCAQHRQFGKLPLRVLFTDRARNLTVDVVDGDEFDARTPWNDGRGVCVGLRLKGTNRAKETARRLDFAKWCSRGRTEVVDTLQRAGTSVVFLS
jgi:hypothetical protein